MSHEGVTTGALIFIWPREETSGLQLSCSGFVATLLKEVQQVPCVPCDRCVNNHGVVRWSTHQRMGFFVSAFILIVLSHGFTSNSHRYMQNAYSLCANLKWYECFMCHFQGGGSASECFRDQALCCYRMRGSFISLQQNHQFVNPVIGWMVRPGEMNLGWCGVELEAGMAGTLWRAFWSEVEIQQGKVTMTGLS